MGRRTRAGSQTAEYMAFFRALESRREPTRRLFADPQAQHFLRPSLRALARAARFPALRALLFRAVDALYPGARPAGVARTRLIDDVVREAVEGGLGQLVVLGAGFDSRALRLPELAAVRTFEVDRSPTLAHGRRCLTAAGIAIPERVRPVEADLEAPGLAERLVEAGFDPASPAFFLCEGVTNYLSAAAVGSLLGIVSHSRPGSRILFTYVHADVVEDAARFQGTSRLVRMLRRVNEPWTFGLRPAEIGGFLSKHGLELVWERGSEDYRAAYWGRAGGHLAGYAFYRMALACVPGEATASAGVPGASEE